MEYKVIVDYSCFSVPARVRPKQGNTSNNSKDRWVKSDSPLREAPETDFHGGALFRACVSVSGSLKLKIGRLLHEIRDFWFFFLSSHFTPAVHLQKKLQIFCKNQVAKVLDCFSESGLTICTKLSEIDLRDRVDQFFKKVFFKKTKFSKISELLQKFLQICKNFCRFFWNLFEIFWKKINFFVFI